MSVTFNKLKRDFSQIPNAIFVDNRLSHGAVRVFCYIASKPDNWHVNNTDVMRQISMSRVTLAKYWAELEACGWLTRTMQRASGRLVGYDYELQSEPMQETPAHKNLAQVNLAQENCTHSKTDSINKELSNTEEHIKHLVELSFDRFWAEWPKKKAGKRAKAAWVKLNPDESLVKKIIEAVITQRDSKSWKKENGQYIPYPATWINGELWNDDTDTRPKHEASHGTMAEHLRRVAADKKSGVPDDGLQERVAGDGTFLL